MSIVITTDVACDGDGCRASVGGAHGRTAAQCRREASEFGWTRRGDRDLCHWCSVRAATVLDRFASR